MGATHPSNGLAFGKGDLAALFRREGTSGIAKRNFDQGQGVSAFPTIKLSGGVSILPPFDWLNSSYNVLQGDTLKKAFSFV
jgi:hypothetical protein